MNYSRGPFLKLICGFWSLWPRSWVRWVGSLLGILWFDILRFRRQVVLDNLDIAFPEKDRAWKIKTGRHALRMMGGNFSEFFTLPSMDQGWVKKNAIIEGFEHYQNANAQGRGVFLLSLHMGAYDVSVSMIPLLGYEAVLISKFFNSRWLNHLWFSIRGAHGVKFIDPHGPTTAFDILKALKRKASVIFVMDQFMGRPFGIPTTFFGRMTGSAYGLALFVLKTKAPVIPVYSYHDEDGKMHLVFEPEVTTQEWIRPDKEESIRLLTQAFNDRLESIVRKHPDEWMWVHRRWKEYE